MKIQSTILVTGASGFVGRHLVRHLAAQGHEVIAASRTAFAFDDPKVSHVALPDLSTPFNWQPLLEPADAVVHLAGIADNFGTDDLYDRINHLATAALAHAAFRC